MSAEDEAEDEARGAALAAWLRALAAHAELDPAFAAQLLTTLRESDLLGALGDEAAPAAPAKAKRAQRAARAKAAPASPAATAPDPFGVYRTQGEERLRSLLDTLDLPTLHVIVRSHRLDPARISARWSSRERVIALIVDQVRARANHGRAFERI